MCLIFIRISNTIHSPGTIPKESEKSTQAELKNEWKKFLWLGIAVVTRSIIHHNINTFLPLYWINELNISRAEAGVALSFMFFCGAAATVAGGYLADRFGIINIIRAGWILLIPSLFLLTRITNPIGAYLILIPLAFGIHMINTPVILLGQKYLPINVGFASGITMGLGNSIGGLAAPLFGTYADLYGLSAIFQIFAFLPLIGVFIAFTIKQPAKQ
jgi:FSR family fosmidomycin resistance protein-like MFS transporter